jgi:hypothetical protein
MPKISRKSTPIKKLEKINYDSYIIMHTKLKRIKFLKIMVKSVLHKTLSFESYLRLKFVVK